MINCLRGWHNKKLKIGEVREGRLAEPAVGAFGESTLPRSQLVLTSPILDFLRRLWLP
jgi:hypothetical protein